MKWGINNVEVLLWKLSLIRKESIHVTIHKSFNVCHGVTLASVHIGLLFESLPCRSGHGTKAAWSQCRAIVHLVKAKAMFQLICRLKRAQPVQASDTGKIPFLLAWQVVGERRIRVNKINCGQSISLTDALMIKDNTVIKYPFFVICYLLWKRKSRKNYIKR